MITREEIIKIYGLANLHIADEDIDEVREKFSTIMDYADILKEIDKDENEILELVTDKNVELREDLIKPSVKRSDALKNSAMTEYGYFKLERVVE